MSYCSKCGKEVAEGSSVCINCGEKLGDIQNNVQNSDRPSSHSTSTKSILAMTCGIIIFIIWLVYGIKGLDLTVLIFGLPAIILGIISLKKHEEGKAFAIIGIILGAFCIFSMTVTLFSYYEKDRASRNETRQTVAKLRIESLESALKLYKLDNGSYPTTEQGINALVIAPASAINWRQGGYLEKGKVPRDPWGTEFIYVYPGNHGDFDLTSFGADGKPGGEGFDKDINNWEFE